ncbi:hypothetical protein [Bacillus paralicheniformis]|uniref:hypothetical protein n=1 Tax=Bacillus paralicheniformis TaxID=1648923 RepID=UPI002243BD71|nr:hypothetical protein [Bacillus paralicheniformis]UZN54087.1 hypothetical protein OPU65_19430 [Bacillus paralicheniformis]
MKPLLVDIAVKKIEWITKDDLYHGGINIKKIVGVSIVAAVRFEFGTTVKGDFYFPGDQDMSFSQAEQKIRELFTDQGKEGVTHEL